MFSHNKWLFSIHNHLQLSTNEQKSIVISKKRYNNWKTVANLLDSFNLLSFFLFLIFFRFVKCFFFVILLSCSSFIRNLSTNVNCLLAAAIFMTLNHWFTLCFQSTSDILYENRNNLLSPRQTFTNTITIKTVDIKVSISDVKNELVFNSRVWRPSMMTFWTK